MTAIVSIVAIAVIVAAGNRLVFRTKMKRYLTRKDKSWAEVRWRNGSTFWHLDRRAALSPQAVKLRDGFVVTFDRSSARSPSWMESLLVGGKSKIVTGQASGSSRPISVAILASDFYTLY